MATFSEKLASFSRGKKIGYVGFDGETAIEPTFDDGGEFREGLCRVRIGARWQFIDKKGVVAAESRVVGETWNDAEDYHGGLARIHTGGTFEETRDGPSRWADGRWHYIDRRGRIIATCRDDRMEQFGYGKESP